MTKISRDGSRKHLPQRRHVARMSRCSSSVKQLDGIGHTFGQEIPLGIKRALVNFAAMLLKIESRGRAADALH